MLRVSMSLEEPPKGAQFPARGFCEERNRLLDAFLQASREILALQTQQIQAVIKGDSEFGSFDVLLQLAQEKKEAAKYAWIAHVHSHKCAQG